MPRPKKNLVRLHEQHNRTTRRAWDWFEPHRARVMALLADAPRGRTVLLGAGNCNDVDLDLLAARNDEVHLVDIDRSAMDEATARLSEAHRPKIAQSVMDLGFLEQLPTWKRTRPEPAELARVLTQPLPTDTLGTFDTVVSPCVLSQLVWTCKGVFGSNEPLLNAVANAVALTHLRACASLLKDRGRLLLVTDTVVCTPPMLQAIRATGGGEQLAAHLARQFLELEAHGRCYPFTQPSFVADILQRMFPRDPVTLSAPWIWTISENRAHLTYAVTVDRGGVV